MWAGATAATLLLLLVLSIGRHRPNAPVQVQVRPQPVEQPRKPAVESTRPPGAEQAAKHQPRPEQSARHRQEPVIRPQAQNAGLALSQRPPVFPTPVPLSEQEQLLLRYVARTPRGELIAQSHPDDPPAVGERESDIAVPDLVFVPQKTSNTR